MIFLYGQSSCLEDTLGFGASVPGAVGTTLRIGCQLLPVGTTCTVLVGTGYISYILKVKLEQNAIYRKVLERYQKGIQQHQRIRASATSAHQQDFFFFVNMSNASGLQVVP